jgi:hypothetical protein
MHTQQRTTKSLSQIIRLSSLPKNIIITFCVTLLRLFTKFYFDMVHTTALISIVVAISAVYICYYSNVKISNKTLFVIGGTGQQGLAFIEQILQSNQNFNIRTITRDINR